MISTNPARRPCFSNRLRKKSGNKKIELPPEIKIPNPGADIEVSISADHSYRHPGLIEIYFCSGIPSVTVVCLPSEVTIWHAWLLQFASAVPSGFEFWGDEAEIVTVAAVAVIEDLAGREESR